MRKLLKHIGQLVPALLLASLILIIPQINNSELMLPTQSGKAFGLLCGMLCYLVITVFIAAIKREMVTIRMTTVDLLLGAYSLMVVISYWLHPVDPLQMLSFFALLLFYLSVRLLNRKHIPLLLVAVAVSGTIQAVYGNLQLWGYYPSHHGLFRITGSFFNPGPYAGYLAAVLPVAVGLYFWSLNVASTQARIIGVTTKTIRRKKDFSHKGSKAQRKCNMLHGDIQMNSGTVIDKIKYFFFVFVTLWLIPIPNIRDGIGVGQTF